MEENKYYTPEIEEFHVGFEFEYLNHNGEWKECELGKNDIENTALRGYKDDLMKVAHAICRVKFLDREDIESLGWEHDQTTKDGAVFYIGTLMDEKQWMLTAENARKAHDYTKIHVCNVNNTLDDYFSGQVKNKSELRKLMKMLQITK